MVSCWSVALVPLLIFHVSPTSTLPFRLATLLTSHNSIEELALDFAFDQVVGGNDNPGRQLEVTKTYIDQDNLYNVSAALCDAINDSAVGIVYSGNSRHPLPSVIQSYCDAYHLSHVTFQTGHSEMNRAFELQPRVTSAVKDILAYFEWTRFAVIYDEEEAMDRYMSLVSEASTTRNRSREKRKAESSIKFVFDNASINASLRDIQRSDESNMILFLSHKHTEFLFRVANERQMLTQKYNYVVADLRMPCRNVQFNISGKINITCFQIIDSKAVHVQKVFEEWAKIHPKRTDSGTQLEVALAYDSLQVMNQVAQTLLSGPYRPAKTGASSKTCLARKVFPYQNTELVRKTLFNVKIEGVTGNIEFDSSGNRKNFKLAILDVGLMEVHKRIGNWSDTGGLESELQLVDIDDVDREDIGRRLLRVTSVLSEPFTMIKPEFANLSQPEIRKEHLHGFLLDVMEEACRMLGLDYQVWLVKDGKYGAENQNDHTWNGMIGELLRGEADVALAPLTMNSARQEVVDFTKPLMTLGISIMMQKPKEKDNGIFSFLHPLHSEIWMCCVLAYLSVSVVLFLVSRFSSVDRFKKSLKESEDGSEEATDDEEDFGIFNCLWFSLGSFMQQGGDVCPNSLPGRMVASSWWFFTLIIISSYTANLAAFLTVDRMKAPIKGAEDLAAQTKIEYGVLDQSSSQGFFLKSEVGTYQRMYSFMKEKGHFLPSTAAGVEKVQKDENFAFIMESIMMEYYNQQEPCNTQQVGGKLNVIEYGIATPKDSPYLANFTVVLLQMQEKNRIDKLKQQWWYLNSPCGNVTESSSSGSGTGAAALKMDRVKGVFYLVMAAVAIGSALALAEFAWISANQAADSRVSTLRALRANWGMALTSKYRLPKPMGLLKQQQHPGGPVRKTSSVDDWSSRGFDSNCVASTSQYTFVPSDYSLIEATRSPKAHSDV